MRRREEEEETVANHIPIKHGMRAINEGYFIKDYQW